MKASINQQRIAEKSVHFGVFAMLRVFVMTAVHLMRRIVRLMPGMRLRKPLAEIIQRAVCIERAILNHQRQVEFAAWQRKRLFLVILDDKQSGKAEIDLLGGKFVWMWMIPIRPGAVFDLEFVDRCHAWRNGVFRMPVHLFRHMQTVPVNNRRFRQRVFQKDADFFAALNPTCRP